MRTFEIHVVDSASLEDIDFFEIEVEDKEDLARLTHPAAAQEYVEQLQSIIRRGWNNG